MSLPLDDLPLADSVTVNTRIVTFLLNFTFRSSEQVSKYGWQSLNPVFARSNTLLAP
jgi:hypothetical protein